MKRFSALVITSIVCLIFLAGCGLGNKDEYSSKPQTADTMAGNASSKNSASSPNFDMNYSASMPEPTDKRDSPHLKTIALTDRKLIKNAKIVIETDDVKKAEVEITAIVQSVKGYIGELNEAQDSLGTKSVTVVLRVPADQLESLLPKLEALGTVLDKNVSSNDVTEEFIDVDSRVRNLKQTEERLLVHMSKTTNVKDILEVEKEINRVRGEIESAEGRLKYLESQTSFSTINVTVTDKAKTQAFTPSHSYSAGKEASSATRALVAFGQGLLSLVIWLAIWFPVWGIPLLLFILIIRWLIRISAKPKPVQPGQ